MKAIYARNTYISPVDNEIAQKFVEDNHRQGAVAVKTKLHSIGLIHRDTDELVAVIQICYPRTSKKQREYSNEILRLAFKKDTRVPGGASKLIKHFINTYNPADLFTYQDATGENTSVYEHAGLKFVSQSGKKEYLVAPGKTLETGNRKEVLGMAYAVKYGPDRILGTKLGEVFDPTTGKRKTNKQLFVEELGWSVQETTGDKVYEWVNPNLTYYTYKITASDSSKYYYGVSHVKKANASVEECLAHDYFGSGGPKFKGWKNKHKDKLQKQIIQTYSRKALAFEAEKKLIGESYRTDPLCLNTSPGGTLSTAFIDRKQAISTMKHCPVHGESTHRGNSCVRCYTNKSTKIKECPIHGEATHRGSSCTRCYAGKSIHVKVCSVHGETKHKGDLCSKCFAASLISEKECPVHGVTTFQSDSCMKCVAQASTSLKECPVHGESSHVGDVCRRCLTEGLMSSKSCPVHGVVTHRGDACISCVNDASRSLKVCDVHGETLHNGDSCMRCSRALVNKVGFCEIHGETVMNKDKCSKCIVKNAYSLKECPVHGLVKHRGDACATCGAEASNRIDVCPLHGETKFRKDKCFKCVKLEHNPNREKYAVIDKDITKIVERFLDGVSIATFAREYDVPRDWILSAFGRGGYRYDELRAEVKAKRKR